MANANLTASIDSMVHQFISPLTSAGDYLPGNTPQCLRDYLERFYATPYDTAGGQAIRTALQAQMAAVFATLDALIAGDYTTLKASCAALDPTDTP